MRWIPDTDPNLVIDYTDLVNGKPVPTQILDKSTGTTYVQGDGNIDAVFRVAYRKQMLKNSDFLQDAQTQFPNFPFDKLEFDFSNNKLNIDASGITLAQRNALKTRLAATPYFDRVVVPP